MTWSPDGKTIVLGNRSDKVLWVDVEEQRIVRKEENVREVRLVSYLFSSLVVEPR